MMNAFEKPIASAIGLVILAASACGGSTSGVKTCTGGDKALGECERDAAVKRSR